MTIDKKEMDNYWKMAKEKYGDDLMEIEVEAVDDENVNITYFLKSKKFERIRRITGYLVGTVDRWNNAKRSEEKDRVKHSL